jgi:hypothetical protein
LKNSRKCDIIKKREKVKVIHQAYERANSINGATVYSVVKPINTNTTTNTL